MNEYINLGYLQQNCTFLYRTVTRVLPIITYYQVSYFFVRVRVFGRDLAECLECLAVNASILWHSGGGRRSVLNNVNQKKKYKKIPPLKKKKNLRSECRPFQYFFGCLDSNASCVLIHTEYHLYKQVKTWYKCLFHLWSPQGPE